MGKGVKNTVNLSLNNDYTAWLKALKAKLHQRQLKAAVQVNSTLLMFYWELGEEIVLRQREAKWGEGFLKQLSKDMRAEFPDIKGFSLRNMELIRQWYLFWSDAGEITKQLVSQLIQVPWGHNLKIVSKCQEVAEALYYVQETTRHGWSRNVLVHQIESGLWQRDGKAVNNFATSLPAAQSDLARQTLKDPYIFDFLTLSASFNERELEQALIDHITHFLLELGAGFAYMGKQVHLLVGERDFYIDLLFYHTHLHCYVVIELKIGDFEPEYVGKLNFYIKAVDEQMRTEADAQTIGLLLCKNKDKVVAEYSLSDIDKPMGIAQYQLTRTLPKRLQKMLPGVDEIIKGLEGEL